MNQPPISPLPPRPLALVAGTAGGRDRAVAALLEARRLEVVFDDMNDPTAALLREKVFDVVVLGQAPLVPEAGYAAAFRDFEERVAHGTRAARAALEGMLERDRGRIVVLTPPGLSLTTRLLASLAAGSNVAVSGLAVGRPWGKALAAWAEAAARNGGSPAPETARAHRRIGADERASALAFLHQFRELLDTAPEGCGRN